MTGKTVFHYRILEKLGGGGLSLTPCPSVAAATEGWSGKPVLPVGPGEGARQAGPAVTRSGGAPSGREGRYE